MAIPNEKSGVHLTGADSGWPVAAAAEPDPKKPGTGVDGLTKAQTVSGNVILDAAKANEVEVITLTNATGGTFTVSYGGSTTGAMPYNSTAASLKTALEGLPSIGVGNVNVTGNAGGPYTVTFQGTLANQNVTQVTVNGASLTGASPTIVATTTTQGAS